MEFTQYTEQDLFALDYASLRTFAKNLGVPQYYKMNRYTLIVTIEEKLGQLMPCATCCGLKKWYLR